MSQQWESHDNDRPEPEDKPVWNIGKGDYSDFRITGLTPYASLNRSSPFPAKRPESDETPIPQPTLGSVIFSWSTRLTDEQVSQFRAMFGCYEPIQYFDPYPEERE